MINISAADGGLVGLGCRMGQKSGTSDGIWMSAEPQNNGSAIIRVHQSRGGNETNMTVGNITWRDDQPNNVTLVCATGNSSIEVRLYINNQTHGGAFAVNISGYRDPGSLFLVASGANKSFSSMSVSTHADVTISTNNCVSANDVKKQIAQLSGVLPSTVLVNMTHAGSCSADSCTNDSSPCGSTMSVSFSDSSKIARYGYVVGTAMDLPQLASQISLHAQELVSEGALDAIGIEVASFSVIPASIAADAVLLELPAIGNAASSILSTAAIIGIAVGGGAAAVLAISGITTAAVMVAKKHQSSPPVAESTAKQAPVRNTLQRFVERGNGVDVMNSGAEHSSITGRAPPVEL